MTAQSGQMNVREIQSGEIIFRQGDAGDELYVLQQGKVALSRRFGGRDNVIATLSAGDLFGEMAIVNRAPRTATATVIEDAKLVVVGESTFEQMVRSNAEVAVRLIQKLAARLDNADKQIDLLMHRDPAGRVVHGLLQAVRRGGEATDGGTRIATDPGEMAQRLGLTEAEAEAVFDRLVKVKLIHAVDNGHWVVGDCDKLKEYLAAARAAGQM